MPCNLSCFAAILLALGPGTAPSVQAASGSCEAEALPVPVAMVPLTVHTLVNMPTCTSSASCTGCTSMSAKITVEGVGLVSGQMLATGPGGDELVACANVNVCTDTATVSFTSLTFYCEGSNGDLDQLEAVDPVPTVAVGLKIKCEVG
ncbi:MAG: hypothetical protein QOD77_377 [Thermoplasmata archaeon]|nr:hypothetical protein [Thermoplasmata archaeon]